MTVFKNGTVAAPFRVGKSSVCSVKKPSELVVLRELIRGLYGFIRLSHILPRWLSINQVADRGPYVAIFMARGEEPPPIPNESATEIARDINSTENEIGRGVAFVGVALKKRRQIVALKIMILAAYLEPAVKRISPGLDDRVQKYAWQRCFSITRDGHNLKFLPMT